jgi:O-acetyl-ADP-ribose deacetylase (regulator of RNase III)
MSGGVNGAILARGGQSIQSELRNHLAAAGVKSLAAGTVVQSTAGPLPFQHILHAIAIDPFYDSSPELIRTVLESAFAAARTLGAQSISMPTLATGYGHLTVEEFAEVFATVTRKDWSPLTSIRIVVRSEDTAMILRQALSNVP